MFLRTFSVNEYPEVTTDRTIAAEPVVQPRNKGQDVQKVNLRFQSHVLDQVSQPKVVAHSLIIRRSHELIREIAPHCPTVLQIRVSTDQYLKFKHISCQEDELRKSVRQALVELEMVHCSTTVTTDINTPEVTFEKHDDMLRSAICAPQQRENGSWLIVGVVRSPAGSHTQWSLAVGDELSADFLNLHVICSMGRGAVRIVHSTELDTVLSLELSEEVIRKNTQHTVHLKTNILNGAPLISRLTFFS